MGRAKKVFWYRITYFPVGGGRNPAAFFVFMKMLDLPDNEKAKVGAENFPMGVSRWRWYRSAEKSVI